MKESVDFLKPKHVLDKKQASRTAMPGSKQKVQIDMSSVEGRAELQRQRKGGRKRTIKRR